MSSVHPEDPAVMTPGQSIEEFIAKCISTIKYDQARAESKFIERKLVDSVYHEIHKVISNQYQSREHFQMLDRMYTFTYNVHLSVVILQQSEPGKMNPDGYVEYVNVIKATLDELVKDSYDDEKRRLEVAFGLVDAVSELLIAELHVFGVTPDQATHGDAKCIRKFIANLLTNLVYGNAYMKRRLCNYSGFVENVTTIIRDSPCLTVFYAALIRNLSWNADETTKNVLTGIISVLAGAALLAHTNNDQKCLVATLSALWNLGSHSEKNKKAICGSKQFLPMIIGLLDCSPANTLLVENASGVLKYACNYFVRDPALLKKLHSCKLIKQLVLLLNSPSFTVVASALNSLAQLTKYDEESQERLFKNSQAMVLLEKLVNSTREDIRREVKEIFTNLNSSRTPRHTYSMPSSARTQGAAMAYYSPRQDQSSAMYDPALQHSHHYKMPYPMVSSYNQHSTFPKSVFSSTNNQQYPQRMTQNHGGYQHARSTSQPPEENAFLHESDVSNEAGKGIPESLLGTRSGSVQSLIEEVSNLSWQSNINTNAANSVNGSPVSESEIPDSPTEFAAQQVAIQKMSAKKMESNDFYGAMNSVDDVLSKVINSALPKPASSRPILINHVTPHLPKTTRLPTVPLFEVHLDLPRSPDCCSDIDFDDSIVEDVDDNQPTPPMASVSSSMASSDVGSTATDGSTTTASKNELPSTVESCHHPQAAWMMTNAAAHPSRDLKKKESLLLQSSGITERIRDPSCLYQKQVPTQREEDLDDRGELSDDSYCCTNPEVVALEDLTAVPEDVDQAFLAEKLIIDCGSLNRSFSRKKSSGIPKPSPGTPTSNSKDSAQNVKIGLLSAATIKRLSKSRHPLPLVPSKTRNETKSPTPKSSARVSPYNYRERTARTSSNCQEKNQNSSPASSKLLVTTV